MLEPKTDEKRAARSFLHTRRDKCEATPVVFRDMEVWIQFDLCCTTEAKMQCMQKHVPMLRCKSLAGKSPHVLTDSLLIKLATHNFLSKNISL